MKVSLNVVKQSVDFQLPAVDALVKKIGAQLGAVEAVTKHGDDTIIDIENKMFTHRPDCFGWLGVARELAGIQHKPFESPDWYVTDPKIPAPESNLKLHIKNELPKLVPRFTAITMSDVGVGPSPDWLQELLVKLGQKPVNVIVDLTNYYMLLTGQPLHAYDYDKVKDLSSGETTIVIREPKKGEKIRLLNGKEVEPRGEAIMIAIDKQPIGIGGVMGGAETEVDESTTNIILECANFDMYSVRRTAMEHGLFTDAATCFTKGQSPWQCLAVSAKTVADIQKLAGGKIASQVIDATKDNIDFTRFCPDEIDIETSFINKLLGLKLTSKEIEKLLINVEFKIQRDGDSLTVGVPFWRTDVEIVEDVVEEVGRLYGYDHLPLELPRRELIPPPKDPLLELKSEIRGRLSKVGANEVLTYSFVHGDLLDRVGQDRDNAFQIANALSPDLQYYRLSLIPSLLEKVHTNIKAGYDEFALFEIGKAHLVGQNDKAGLPREDELTALVVAAADKLKKPGAAYYEVRKYLTDLIPAELTFKPVPEAMHKYDVTKPYDTNRAAFAYAGDTFVGIIGEFRAPVRRALKLPRYSAGFELDTTELMKVFKGTGHYVALPRFPKVIQDITLKVPADLSYQELSDSVRAELNKAKPQNTLLDLSPLDIFQPEKARHKNITFRLTVASYQRTLTDAEVNQLLDTVAAAAHKKFGAERV